MKKHPSILEGFFISRTRHFQAQRLILNVLKSYRRSGTCFGIPGRNNTDRMILEQDVTGLICGEISDPSLQMELNEDRNVFHQADSFAEYAIGLIRKCDLQKLVTCFRIADWLLLDGCASVKIAVTNVFMYAVSLEMDRSTNVQEKIMQAMTPGLADVYRRQLMTNGV